MTSVTDVDIQSSLLRVTVT